MRKAPLGRRTDVERELAARLDAELDARVVAMLARRPEPEIPLEFAVRVAAQVPKTKAPVALQETHYGRNAAIAAMAVLVVVLFALAPRTGHAWELGTVMEWVFCAQLLGLGVWLAVRGEELR